MADKRTPPPAYNVRAREVADELNVTPRTAQLMCKEGDIPAIKVRSVWRIRADWRRFVLPDAPATQSPS